MVSLALSTSVLTGPFLFLLYTILCFEPPCPRREPRGRVRRVWIWYHRKTFNNTLLRPSILHICPWAVLVISDRGFQRPLEPDACACFVTPRELGTILGQRCHHATSDTITATKVSPARLHASTPSTPYHTKHHDSITRIKEQSGENLLRFFSRETGFVYLFETPPPGGPRTDRRIYLPCPFSAPRSRFPLLFL